MADLQDAFAFIYNAEASDLDRIIDKVKERRRAIRDLAAAAVRFGSQVKLGGLSPKYLNGLTGTVQAVHGTRCDVELDKDSTITLRYSGRRYNIRHDVETYVLHGVPLGCALVQVTSDA